MNPEFLLPGTVILFKSVLRLMIDRQVTSINFAKAFLSFPVDLTFLSLSYGVASIVSAQQRGANWPITVTLAVIMLYALVGVLTIFVCSKSDRAFDAERNVFTAATCFLAYAVAFLTLGITMFGGVF